MRWLNLSGSFELGRAYRISIFFLVRFSLKADRTSPIEEALVFEKILI